jgi:hypothetical protein
LESPIDELLVIADCEAALATSFNNVEDALQALAKAAENVGKA